MKTTTVETSQLTGAALDWAVAKASGENIQHDPMGFGSQSKPNGGFWVWNDVSGPKLKIGAASSIGYHPSGCWRLGGPLIEKYELEIERVNGCSEPWVAFVSPDRPGEAGETLLIAAMRAIVAASLGNKVEVPADLVEVRDA